MLHKILLKIPLGLCTLIFETIVFLFEKYNDKETKYTKCMESIFIYGYETIDILRFSSHYFFHCKLDLKHFYGTMFKKTRTFVVTDLSTEYLTLE